MAAAALFKHSFFCLAPDATLSKNNLDTKKKQLRDYNKTQGGGFLRPLNFYTQLLDKTDPACLSYMSDKQKKILLYDLHNAILLIQAQKEYEQAHQKTEFLPIYNDQLAQCMRLLAAMNHPVDLLYDEAIVPKPLTKPLQDKMRRFNEKRLYWVWGSALIKLVMDQIPSDVNHIEHAKNYIRIPDLYTGFISWALYYFRFTLNMILLLKHCIAHPWMSEEELAEPWRQRLGIQWNLRKYAILNDLIWATGNLLCYFWLFGSGIAGVWGDLLTVILLLFDVSLACWSFYEQSNAHTEELNALRDTQKELCMERDKLLLISKEKRNNEQSAQIKDLTLRFGTLKRMQELYEQEWSYQKISLISDLVYAIGLMLAFILATLPFFPATLPIASLSALGTILCFTMTVVSNCVKGAIDIYRSEQSLSQAQKGIAAQLELLPLTQCIASQKDLFLEIKKLMLEIKYQEQDKVLKTAQLIRLFLIQIFVPAAIVSALVFLSAGFAVLALSLGMGLAVASERWVNEYFAFNKQGINEFDEDEFNEFTDNPGVFISHRL